MKTAAWKIAAILLTLLSTSRSFSPRIGSTTTVPTRKILHQNKSYRVVVGSNLQRSDSGTSLVNLLGDGEQGRMTGTTTTQLQVAIPGAIESLSLTGGAWGIISLTILASGVCIPLTQIKNVYGISVGYGLSIGAIGYALRTIYDVSELIALPNLATAAAIFYGLRLAGYLFIRDISGLQQRESTRKDPARLQRIPFALSVAVFYAFLTTPLLYLLRDPVLTFSVTNDLSSTVATVGVVTAWIGALLEAVADTQKFIVKLQTKPEDRNSQFTGPTNLAYAITRHPNYTGEIVFWTGLFLSGLPGLVYSFSTSTIIGLVCSTIGLFGILSIMFQATSGLEQRQAEKYDGQPLYDEWKQKVTAPLIPFIKG